MSRLRLVQHWVSSSNNDYKPMMNLFKSGYYAWSLFFGHLVLEKLIKACYVLKTGEEAPFVHDLNKLAFKAGLTLTEDQKDLFDSVTTFNISARYPDYKQSFSRKATKKYSEEYIKQIKGMRKWLIAHIKEQS